MLLIAALEPVHLALPALPFGLFGGLPGLFIFDTRFDLTYRFVGFAGMVLNAIGFVGFFGGLEKRRERRLEMEAYAERKRHAYRLEG